MGSGNRGRWPTGTPDRPLFGRSEYMDFHRKSDGSEASHGVWQSRSLADRELRSTPIILFLFSTLLQRPHQSREKTRCVEHTGPLRISVHVCVIVATRLTKVSFWVIKT